MSASSSSVIPTPLAHADNQGEGHPRGRPHTVCASADEFIASMLSISQKMKNSLERGCIKCSHAGGRHPRIGLELYLTATLGNEAHFWLNGYVNKQNCRIWSEANPQVYVKTPLHPEKLTVWCALWAGGILLQKR
ncbi:hypothetical protein TNCV_4303991 [Trichonephila clavipes]|nr:hypothetical protein TNCV_4303991 [Trichonephila clavipes]